MSNGRHMTYDDRLEIEKGLKNGVPASKIAAGLGVSRSTVTREIEIHSRTDKAFQCECVHFRKCRLRDLCDHCPTGRLCKDCPRAKQVCHRYEHAECEKKSGVHTCNHCAGYSSCKRSRCKYNAKVAQSEYETYLRESRSGFSATEEELEELSVILQDGFKRGLSLYAIMTFNKEKIRFSEDTVRKMIEKSKINGVMNMDLPRAVTYKKRNYDYRHRAEVSEAKKGHTKEDFDAFLEQNPGTRVVEMDTVLSKKGTKAALLTLMFVDTTFQIIHLMDSNTTANVIRFFDNVESSLGTAKFRELFPVILTDNGTEFDEFMKIEDSIYGGKRTSVFFCHPYRSNEKPHCENNHALIRRMLPKGIDFSKLTQGEADLVMNNLNSYPREKLRGQTPADLMLMELEVFEINFFRLEYVAPDKLDISTNLLKSFLKRTGQDPKTLGSLADLTDEDEEQ